MKTKIVLGFSILAAMLISACTPTNTSDTTAEEITLIPNKDTIFGNGLDTLTFNVLCGEEDVTADAKIFTKDNQELVNKTFTTTIPGEYVFFATYDNRASDYKTVIALGDLELTADKTFIAPDGSETVTFTVLQQGEDVSSESELYLLSEDGGEPELQDGMTFSTSEIGKYEFYATKDNGSSNRVTVGAIASDDNPDGYNFKERAFVMEFTGTWCGWCAIVKATIHQLEASGWDGIPAEVHDGDIMALPIETSLWRTFATPAGATGFPSVTFNMDKSTLGGAYNTTVATNASLMQNTLTSVLESYPCTAGICANLTLEDNLLTLTAGVKCSDEGEYRIGAWFMENEIVATQANYTPDFVSTTEVSTHMNVLRAIANTADLTGDDILPGGIYNYTFDIDDIDLINGDINKCHVIVFVTKKEANGNYIVNNIIRCGINETVPFEYTAE